MNMLCSNHWNNTVANFMASLASSKKKKKTSTNKQLSLQWSNLNKVP